MGRKSSAKSKEKRLKRKEEQQKILQAMAVVDKANKLTDPLEPFPVFRKFNKNGIEAELFTQRVTDLDESTKSWIFNLTKRNMQLKYEQCSWGWNDNKKMEELMDEAAWYLIAKGVDGTFLGFSHFRFDMDEGIEVLYCYELQLEPAIQRKGLGKFMMQILELIAFKNNMRKVILTILKNNHYSKFFRALNYELDETSPIDYQDETFPYEILSKVNKRLASSTTTNINNKKPGQANGHSHCCSGHHHHPLMS
ncbi:N-alpha-acetyltransferase 40 [Tribolium castaneum]|uniref:N-alpha-acetyltransferase 40 n=1 Tax=Tribolium castaneum TaxID=7070 RepID=D6WTU5_TRICA|nr:PREDICTED: N-alpha-acetyltransferase 40 [Tribolium castaneum]EFA07325.1 N-alpha-acetyltransferase 40-like Protein [Tribolium castaneum]|eukprot:XP_967118.1 PREDICTED: N-alpha-acetyltransferase 40 [Tribolium castaneum]